MNITHTAYFTLTYSWTHGSVGVVFSQWTVCISSLWDIFFSFWLFYVLLFHTDMHMRAHKHTQMHDCRKFSNPTMWWWRKLPKIGLVMLYFVFLILNSLSSFKFACYYLKLKIKQQRQESNSSYKTNMLIKTSNPVTILAYLSVSVFMKMNNTNIGKGSSCHLLQLFTIASWSVLCIYYLHKDLLSEEELIQNSQSTGPSPSEPGRYKSSQVCN